MSRKRNALADFKYESTPYYSTLRTGYGITTPSTKRSKRIDVPLPEDTFPGWDEGGYGGVVLAPSEGGGHVAPSTNNPGYSEGGVADSYWQALAAQKGTKGNPRKRPPLDPSQIPKPRARPTLDEERPKPNSSANPSSTQTPTNAANPVKDKPKTPGSAAFVPISAGDDAPEDGEDTFITPLHNDNEPGGPGGDENNDPTNPDPGGDGTSTDPNAGVMDLGGPGGNSADTPTAKPDNIQCTACLTPEEFAKMKAMVFAIHQDVHGSQREREHTGATQGSGTSTEGKPVDNPQTPYVPPGSGTDVTKDGDKKKEDGKPKKKPKDKLLTKEQSDAKDKGTGTSTPKDKGLLGMTGLLSGSAAFWGMMEGISSQYVIGTGALALYCLVNTLDLEV